MPTLEPNPFTLRIPETIRAPILVSAPHVGTRFPKQLENKFFPEVVKQPVDTDWLVHELYSFVTQLGIPLIYAEYSRYVIDLNRSPEDRPLYDDGRLEMGLVPSTSADGQPLYRSKELAMAAQSPAEREFRLNNYYRPYHLAVEDTLHKLQEQFGVCLLFEAHSIRPYIRAIRPEPFPNLMLGDQNGATADPRLTAAVKARLETSHYSFAHNNPFRGGYLTRHFGRPQSKQHALQLEMSQGVYLTEGEIIALDATKAATLKVLLRAVFADLAEVLESLR